jgi:hypothetical protein
MSTTAEYAEAAQRVQAGVTEVLRIKAIISNASHALMYWKLTTVSGLERPIPAADALRASAGRRAPPIIRASDWPTAQAVFDALETYHKAVANLRDCYASLPANEKSIAQPPGQYEGKDDST